VKLISITAPRTGKTGEEFLYDTFEKELRVWSQELRIEKGEDCN